MADKTVRTTLVIGTDTGQLQALEQKLQQVSNAAGMAADRVAAVTGGGGTVAGAAAGLHASDVERRAYNATAPSIEKLEDRTVNRGVKVGDGARSVAEPVINMGASGPSAAKMAALGAQHPYVASPQKNRTDEWSDDVAARHEATSAVSEARMQRKAAEARTLLSRLERRLGIDPTVVDDASTPEGKQQLAAILAKRDRMGRMFSGPWAQMGAAGMALMGGRMALSGLETWQQQSVGREAGLYSGDMFSALSAEAGYNRSITSAWSRAGLSVAQVGGGALAYAGMAGKMGMGLKAGLIGVGLTAGAMIADPLIEGALGRSQARTQAGIGLMSDAWNRRTAIAAGLPDLMALGRNRGEVGGMVGAFGEQTLTAQARELSMTVGEVTNRVRGFFANGGQGGDAWEALRMEKRFGLGAEAQGRFMRGYMPGEGATGGDPQGMMRKVVEEFRGSGAPMQRMTEYLQRIAASNEAMADRGLVINQESADRLRNGLLGSGLSPFQSEGVRGSLQQGMVGQMNSIRDILMPPGVSQALIRQRLLRQGGGLEGAMSLAEKLAADPDAATRFLQGTINDTGYDPARKRAFFSQASGLFPGAAGKLVGYRGRDREPVLPQSAQDIADFMSGMGDKLLGLLKTRTESDVTRTFAVKLDDLTKGMGIYADLIRKQADNIRGAKIDQLFEDLADTLGLNFGVGAGGGRVPPDKSWDAELPVGVSG